MRLPLLHLGEQVSVALRTIPYSSDATSSTDFFLPKNFPSRAAAHINPSVRTNISAGLFIIGTTERASL